MVKIYIADSLGSIIAEKAADCMEEELAVFIEKEVGNTLIGTAPVIADGTYRNNKTILLISGCFALWYSVD